MMYVLMAFFWGCAAYGIWADAGDAFIYGNFIVFWIVLALSIIEDKLDKIQESIKNRNE